MWGDNVFINCHYHRRVEGTQFCTKKSEVLKESVNVSSFVEQLNIQATLIWPAVEALESAMSVVISVCMVRLGLQG